MIGSSLVVVIRWGSPSVSHEGRVVVVVVYSGRVRYQNRSARVGTRDVASRHPRLALPGYTPRECLAFEVMTAHSHSQDVFWVRRVPYQDSGGVFRRFGCSVGCSGGVLFLRLWLLWTRSGAARRNGHRDAPCCCVLSGCRGPYENPSLKT